jgi:hypothetical protein
MNARRCITFITLQEPWRSIMLALYAKGIVVEHPLIVFLFQEQWHSMQALYARGTVALKPTTNCC